MPDAYDWLADTAPWWQKPAIPTLLSIGHKRIHPSHCTDEELAIAWITRTYHAIHLIADEIDARRLDLPTRPRHRAPYYEPEYDPDDEDEWHEDEDE